MEKIILKIIIMHILYYCTTVFCTFEDVDRTTNILNLASPTVDNIYYGNRRANKILPLQDNKFIVVYIGDLGKC